MSDKSFEDDFNDLMAINDPAPEAEDEPQEATQDAEPLAEAPPSAEPQPAPAPAAEPSSLDEILVELPPERAAAFQGLVQKTQHQLRSDSGRMAAMQKLYHEAKQQAAAKEAEANAAAQRIKELEERAKQPMTKAEAEQVASDLDVAKDDFEKEFPEFSNAVNVRIETGLKKLLSQLQPPASQPAPQPQQDRQPPSEAATPEIDALTSQYAALEAAHPDWRQAVSSPTYRAWKEVQTPEVQRLIESNDASDAIRVIDRFKTDLAIVRRRAETVRKDVNRQRLEQNVGIKGGAPRPSAIPDDFESAFNYYAAKG